MICQESTINRMQLNLISIINTIILQNIKYQLN